MSKLEEQRNQAANQAALDLIRILDKSIAANERWIAIHDWFCSALPVVIALLALWILFA